MYYTLIKSIPIHIKSTINTNNTPCTRTSFTENILAKQNKTNKIFYKLQIKHPAENSKIQNKWQSLLGEQEFNWKQIFMTKSNPNNPDTFPFLVIGNKVDL